MTQGPYNFFNFVTLQKEIPVNGFGFHGDEGTTFETFIQLYLYSKTIGRGASYW